MDRIAILSSNLKRATYLIHSLREAGHRVDWLFIAGDPDSIPNERILQNVRIRLLPPKLTDPLFQEHYAHCAPRLSIIAGLTHILPKNLIDLPELGTINLHGGRVPRYRGGSPLNWQIINGEMEIGISILRVDEGIDSGPVLAQACFPISELDDIAFVHTRANVLFAQMTVNVVNSLEAGCTTETPQDETQAAYWHQRNDADGAIHWSKMTAREVHNLVRALAPLYPGAHCEGPSGTVRILKTVLPDLDLRGVPGRVVFLQKHGPYVVCTDRAILVLEYKLSGEGRLRHGIHLA